MEGRYEQLTQASHQVAAVLYQSAPRKAGTPAPAAKLHPAVTALSAGADDDVIDAEYVDVDAEEES